MPKPTIRVRALVGLPGLAPGHTGQLAADIAGPAIAAGLAVSVDKLSDRLGTSGPGPDSDQQSDSGGAPDLVRGPEGSGAGVRLVDVPGLPDLPPLPPLPPIGE